MADIEAQQLSGVEVEKLFKAEGLFNTEIGKRIQSADKDGDGRLTTGDFRSLVWSEIEGWKAAKRLRATVIALSVFAVLILASNVALAIGVAEISKEVRVGGDGVMTAKNGRDFVATGQAAHSVDLTAAPSLDINELRKIHQIIVTEDDGSLSIYTILRVNLLPHVSAEFQLAGGITMTVRDGALSLSSATGNRRLLGATSAVGVSHDSNAVHSKDGVYDYGQKPPKLG